MFAQMQMIIKKIIQNNYRTARYDLKIMPNCFGYVKGHDTVNGTKI